jgi:hypothetical protein
VLLALLPVGIGAADKPQRHVHGVQTLSPALRELLSGEMRALQDAMMSIVPAYVAGNWRQIAVIAGKMRDSYILQQSLSAAQKQELHTVLPAGFVEKDQRFHYLAGMLEHAAQSEKAELINFYFSSLNEACVGCHTSYATHKFPALLVPVETEHGH